MFTKVNSIAIAAVLAMSSTVSHALEFDTFYHIDGDFAYQNNPAFAKDDKDSVFSTRISPSVQFSYTDELTQYNLDLGFSVYQNSNEKVLLDYVAPDITADWSREFEFVRVGLEANYNHIAARTQSLLANGVNNNADNVTRTGTIKGSLDIDFDAKWSLQNELLYQRVTFTEEVANLGDFDLYGGESKLNYQYSDIWASYAAADYFEYAIKSGGLEDSDVYSVVVGGVYTPAENISVDLSFGGYDASGRLDDSGLRFAVEGTYEFDRYTVYGEIYRKMIAAGVGVFQLNENVNVGGSYQLTEVSSFNANLAFNKAKGEQVVGTQDVKFQSLGLAYDRNYEKWKASLYANFMTIDASGPAGGKARNRVFGVRVSYDPFGVNTFRRNPLNF